jgi:hypothetical protein
MASVAARGMKNLSLAAVTVIAIVRSGATVAWIGYRRLLLSLFEHCLKKIGRQSFLGLRVIL